MKRTSTTLLALLLYGIACSQGCIPVRNLVGFGQFIRPQYDSLKGDATKWLVNVNRPSPGGFANYSMFIGALFRF